MKILQYCQHVLGVGHFFRSLEIAKAFFPHEVLFVEGGKKITDKIDAFTHIKFFSLEPLEMDGEFKSFTVEQSLLEKIKQSRKRKLLSLFINFNPDIFIIELFPFGRKKFRFELIPVLEYARAKSDTMVVCSVRDILVEKSDQKKYERRVVDTLNSFFDLVLVHSDPSVITLDETFGSLAEVKVPVEYTGYVVRKCSGKGGVALPENYRRIVVSHGGGRVGSELLEASILASDLLGNEYRIEIFPGIFIPDPDLKRIKDLAQGRPNVHVKEFSLDFIKELVSAHLSVSMAGYNTMMDLLATRTPGLVFPFSQNREQRLRATRFEKMGVVKVLDSFDPRKIALGVRELAGKKEAFKVGVNIDGARRTKEIAEVYFNKRWSY